MKHPEQYKGQHVVVLGLAKSGVSVAKTLHKLGAIVTVNDRKDRKECPEASELEALGTSVICGEHPDNLIHSGVALVVKNPGIPYSAPPVAKAIELGIEVVTEVEIAYRICQASVIGITGSNGKTTTTTWIGQMLESAGLHPIVAGNIGTPLCEAAESAKAHNWMVVELSSFQLKGTDSFRPDIAVLLNVAETHLDYHGTMDDYIQSKAKLLANQTEECTAVMNWDDPICRQLASTVKAKRMPFSMQEELEGPGVFVRPSYCTDAVDESERFIVFRNEMGEVHELLCVNEIGLPGRFNVENALAAVATALAAGASPDLLIEPLKTFKGVEHRLEFVEEKQGVVYYNNSKATNTKATIMALEALKSPIVLIAGGLDRGSDYLDLVPSLQQKVKGIVVMGQTKEKLAEAANRAGLRHIVVVDTEESAAVTLQHALNHAARIAAPGDVVLLSPACASWDMFASYEERGRIFKEAVHNL